ncbi:hypothetical protein NNJEOMEG_01471 [Fundidesulfovibrio magnetotacticus]|uniref:YgjP-like metallopeptidase domain-containing protein n=1 Tax=Fundidesulfovibrio magnetotacticus TaxID=2730080 RepID=A0A6V8LVE1_9BACT|nr:SprT family zinc-dependent metalloprotease [Fundidesulfovibrio magnetotacticus]GFK93637.1 hypothetical protein NNJEOMEG_01471 [Fundidesulfovibrio magnetotacticus]
MNASRTIPPSGLPPLPDYRVRVSARARQVRLVVTPRDGLVVSVPVGFDAALVPEIVAQRLEWVTRTLERVALQRAEALLPPAGVSLRAVGRELTVRYRPGPDGSGSVRVRAAGPVSLEVSGALADRELVARALRTWLKREAARELPPRLDALSARLDLPHAGCVVRLQRSRWGSCSARGTISLNARLLFLPPELSDYVLAHELAHTLHLDHSPAYWRALEERLPGARGLDRQLRHAGRFVPAWSRP